MNLKDVRSKFFEVLEKSELPIYQQGSMSQAVKYPRLFLTYYFPTVAVAVSSDNGDTLTEYIAECAVYGCDSDEVDDMTETIKKDMKDAGFLFVIGGDVQSDEQTHRGYMQRFKFIG